MYMKKLLLGSILLCAGGSTFAQNFQFRIFAGVSNYQGDLQDKKFTFQQSKAAFGIGALYDITEKLSIRGMLSYGKVGADDKKSIKNLDRNLSFTTPITEFSLGLEYDLLNLNEHTITPYIFASVAAYHFNPSAIDTFGNKINLQPLGTEGQGFYLGRKKYSLTQLSIPFGGGFKFALSDNIRVGIEIGLRKLFTDYIDDVSTTFADQAQLVANSGQLAANMAFRGDELKNGLSYPPANSIRGNPKSKDWYYFSGLTLNFRLNSGDGYGRPGKGSQTGCPARVY